MKRLKSNVHKTCIVLLSLIFLSGCSLPGLGASTGNNDIVIAGGNTTERQVLAEIVSQMVSHYMPEVKTGLINNLGSTLLILQTMTGKDTNVSGAMYTGTSLTGELGLPSTTDPEKALQQVIEGYYENYDMVWFPTYGFENTYAFMVTRDFSEQENITKVSQLKDIAPTLRAGVDTSWINRQGDGYEDFKRVYGFDFSQVLPMEIGLVYDAVQAQEMDIVLGYSTDGRIDAYDLVILEDDLNLFPPYNASPVVTAELLKTYPDLETVLLKLENEIDSSAMQALNRRSDEEKIEPQVVAREFLEANNYFEGKTVVPLSERSDYESMMKEIQSNQGKDEQ